MIVNLDEMRLRLQKQVDIAAAVQFGQLSPLQRILLAFQRHKRNPVRLFFHRVKRRVVRVAMTRLLRLYGTKHKTFNTSLALL